VAGDADSDYDRTSSSDLIGGRKRRWGFLNCCCRAIGDVHSDANEILDDAWRADAFDDDPRYSDGNMNPIRPDEDDSARNGLEMVDTSTGNPVSRPSAQSIHEDEREFKNLTSAEMALDFTKAKVQKQRSMSEESFGKEGVRGDRACSADTVDQSEISLPDWLKEQREELEVAKKELAKIELSIADAEKRNEGKCLRSKRNMKRMQNLKSAYLGMLEEVLIWEDELYQGDDDTVESRTPRFSSMTSKEQEDYEADEEQRKEEQKEEFMRNWIQMSYPLKMEQQL